MLEIILFRTISILAGFAFVCGSLSLAHRNKLLVYLKTKIDYYLKHDKERESIRLAGHKRAKEEHTYIERWKTILGELGL